MNHAINKFKKIHTHIYIHRQIHTYIHTYTHIHTNTHTHTYVGPTVIYIGRGEVKDRPLSPPGTGGHHDPKR